MFALAASSIACLLADFYRLCLMRTFTLFIVLPAWFALAALGVADRACGDCGLWRGCGCWVKSPEAVGCGAWRWRSDLNSECC